MFSDATGRLAEEMNRASLNPQMWRRGQVTAVDTSSSPWLATIQGRQMVYVGTLNVGDIAMWHPGPPPFALGARAYRYWNWFEVENQSGAFPFFPPSGFYVAWQPGFPDTFAWPNVGLGGFYPAPWSNAYVFHAAGIIQATGVDIDPFTTVGGTLPVFDPLWTNEHGTSCWLYGPTGTAAIPQFATSFSNNPIIEFFPAPFDTTPRYAVDFRLPVVGSHNPVWYNVNFTSFIVRSSGLRGYSVGPWVTAGGSTPSVAAQAGDKVVFMVATGADTDVYAGQTSISAHQGTFATGHGLFDGPWNVGPSPSPHQMFTPFGVSWIGADVKASGPVSLNVAPNGEAQRLGTFVFKP